jgi:hypothetical protein
VPGDTTVGEGSSSEQAGGSGHGSAGTGGGSSVVGHVVGGPKHGGSKGDEDDREGFIQHPTRGKLPTYIFEVCGESSDVVALCWTVYLHFAYTHYAYTHFTYTHFAYTHFAYVPFRLTQRVEKGSKYIKTSFLIT